MNKKWIGLSLITVLWIVLFSSSGLFTGGFNYFLDDHQILLLAGQGFSWKTIFFEPFAALMTTHAERFRPVYMVFLHLFSAVYGLHAWVWYLSSCLMAIITSILIFQWGRLNTWGSVEALLLVFLIMFGNQASTYARFGTPETTAVLFLSVSFLGAVWNAKSKVGRWTGNGLFIAGAFAAALNKEACILMLPALAMYKIWWNAKVHEATFKQTLKENLGTVIVLSLIFVTCLAFIKMMKVSGPGYAGLSADTFAWSSITGEFKILVKKTSFGLAVLLNLWLIWESWRMQTWKRFEFIGYVLTVGLIVLPQMVLYAKSGIDGHYLFPAVIGIALATIYPVTQLRLKYPVYAKVALLLISLLAAQHLITTFKYFRSTAKTTRAIALLTEEVARRAGSSERILVFGNPWVHFERLFGFSVVADKLIKNNHTYLATYGSKNVLVTTNVFEKDEAGWGFLDLATVEHWYGSNILHSKDMAALADFRVIILLSSDRFDEVFLRETNGEFNSEAYVGKDYAPLDIRVYYKR